MSLHQILKDPECRGNIQCVLWGIVIIMGMLCILIYGIAWMSPVEKISEDIYGAEYLKKRIEHLEGVFTGVSIEWAQKQVEYDNHIHPETNKGFTGKPIGTR